jgi:N-acetylglutamate synthase-like GNAT family acetyltransferase
MTTDIADQIANLLNSRNELIRKYDAKMVIEKKDNYVYLLEDSKLIACAESKKIQWYQWEISHVSVSNKVEGKGIGSKILAMAEKEALNCGAKILQCTIRSDNDRSQRLFLSKGYFRTSSFFNVKSGNWVNVYQKSVCVKEE